MLLPYGVRSTQEQCGNGGKTLGIGDTSFFLDIYSLGA